MCYRHWFPKVKHDLICVLSKLLGGVRIEFGFKFSLVWYWAAIRKELISISYWGSEELSGWAQRRLLTFCLWFPLDELRTVPHPHEALGLSLPGCGWVSVRCCWGCRSQVKYTWTRLYEVLRVSNLLSVREGWKLGNPDCSIRYCKWSPARRLLPVWVCMFFEFN